MSAADKADKACVKALTSGRSLHIERFFLKVIHRLGRPRKSSDGDGQILLTGARLMTVFRFRLL